MTRETLLLVQKCAHTFSFYDAASGQLVAVLYAQNVDEPGCVGGPPSLSIPSAACTWVF